MSRTSKYNEIKTSRVPRRKRTIRMQGSGDDDGKWYRCWYCGFPCNIDRDVIGDGEGFSSLGNSLNLEGDVTINYELKYVPDVVSGCPFCGCKNYR